MLLWNMHDKCLICVHFRACVLSTFLCHLFVPYPWNLCEQIFLDVPKKTALWCWNSNSKTLIKWSSIWSTFHLNETIGPKLGMVSFWLTNLPLKISSKISRRRSPFTLWCNSQKHLNLVTSDWVILSSLVVEFGYFYILCSLKFKRLIICYFVYHYSWLT